MKGSLGLIETRGWIPAVAAADAGLKAANVVLLDYTLTWPALVTITFNGDVASVRAAVMSGSVAAQAVGEVVSTHVIARTQADFETTTPPPFTGQDEELGMEQQQQALTSPPVAEQTKVPKPRPKAASSTTAPPAKKKAPAKKRATKPTAPRRAAVKKTASKQKAQPVTPVKPTTGDVEAVVHDTNATDQKVAENAAATVQGKAKPAAKSGGKTQKAPVQKATPRKRAVASNRKRQVRKRPTTTTQATTPKTSATSASSSAPKETTTEQKKDTTGASPTSQGDAPTKE